MALNRLKPALMLAALSAATFSAVALGTPGAAQAQVYFDAWGGRFNAPMDDYDRGYDRRPYREAGMIGPEEVVRILNRRGYRVDPSIARSSDVYLVNAVDPQGRRLRIVVDAFDGSILRRSEMAPPPRAVSRWEDDDRWNEGGDLPPPPRIIPGVGPTQQRRAPPPPRKPATARVEPRAPVPKAVTAPPPAEAIPAPAPAPAPAAAAPAPAPATTAVVAPPRTAPREAPKPAPETRAEAPAPKVIPAPAAASAPEPAPAAAQPRVIPLYKTPASGAAEKPAEGAP